MFRSRPDDFQDDTVKITYAVSWPKGTAQRWYEPNLALEDYDLLDFATDWATFLDLLPQETPALAFLDSVQEDKSDSSLSEANIPAVAWRKNTLRLWCSRRPATIEYQDGGSVTQQTL